uniref:CCHC-type domain-containing protein n=1 Tax=Gopherus agassizii TaxID=38772 RepID=A0A452GGM3_9SAUR
MGSALSAEEKTVHDFLLRIAEKQGEKISPEPLSHLLKWGQRRGFFVTLNTVFDKTVWERLGSDLWESVAHGSKEAVSLSQIWCKTKKIVETLAAEAGVRAAVDDIFRSKKADESPMVLPEPPVVLPVGAKEFFGREEVIVPTAPGCDPDGPDLDPHTVPLPQDSEGSFENMDTDRTPFTESTEFREEMKRQGHQLQEMLDKLSRMAGETSSPQSHLLKTLQGYENYKAKPPDKPLQSSNNMVLCPRCGLWGCDAHCTGGSPPSTHQLPGRPLAAESSKQASPFLTKPLAYSSDAAGMGSPDLVRRWYGLIKEAHIKGEFLPNAFPVITPDSNNPARRQWAPLDWKLVREAQKAIMSYGMNNPYVQSLVEQVFVGQAMCPYDSSKFADMLLTPTQKLLWKDNWSRRVEMAILHNIDLDENNPLRYATQDMLMGSGVYADPQRQARLDPRILQQSQGLALAAFKDVPQMGKLIPPYAKIVQDPSEPYSTFLDRLREAIDRSPNLTAEAKAAVGLDIATQNANAICRRILATLPKTASLTEMVEACNRASVYEETDKAEIHAKAHASALAVALRPLVRPSKPSRPSGVCFACGKPGHMKKDCPSKNIRVGTENATKAFAGTCNRCDKFGHRASECRSCFKKDGMPLQGNGMRSAHRGGAKTQESPNPKPVVWNTLQEPPEEVPEWTWPQQQM